MSGTIVLMLFLGVGLVWGVCGLLTYSLTLAYFQREFPLVARHDGPSDRRLAIMMGLSGPLGLGITLFCGGIRHGLMWRLPRP